MTMKPAILVTLSPLLICPIIDKFHSSISSWFLLPLAGVICTIIVGISIYFLPKPKNSDAWLYVFVFFGFGCIVDLLLFLEAAGFISGYVAFYLELGEEYLGSPYGLAINLWDFTAHYILYLVMIHKIYKCEPYTSVGLFWAGSIFNSLLVLVPGALFGPYPIRPAILLNIPFIFIPPAFILMQISVNNSQKHKIELSHFLRFVLVHFIFFCLVFCSIRALGLGELKFDVVKNFVMEKEPYIITFNPFYTMQILVYLFYFVPFCIFLLYFCIKSRFFPKFMGDLCIMFSGFVIQGQFGALGPYILADVLNLEKIVTGTSSDIFWVLQLTFTFGMAFVGYLFQSSKLICKEHLE